METTVDINRTYCQDNLDLMRQLPDNFIDLIYCDVLYGTGRDFGYYQDLPCDRQVIEDHYIPRIKEMHRILKDTGSIYLQMDTRINHWVRCIMDDIFGYDNFKNEIIWKRTRSAKFQSVFFSKIHDVIFLFTKTDTSNFNPLFLPHRTELIESHYHNIEEGTGRRYTLNSFTQKGQGETRQFGDRILAPPAGKHWIWSQERIDDGLKSSRIVFTKNGTPRLKKYLDDMKGMPLQDIWIDIPEVNSMTNEREGYPTQKPEALLERIIKVSSDKGDLVADFYCGSGTTLKVAKQLGRNYIGCDISEEAIKISRQRLEHVYLQLF